MAHTVGDFIVQRLKEWGIQRVYGYPGDGIDGVFAGLRRVEGAPRFIQARHEEMSALMACAHAKFTGQVGVCIATSGPGAIHLLNGVQEQKAVPQPPQKHDIAVTGIGVAYPHIVPKQEDLARAADVLNRADRVAMLVGQGALGATDEVIQTAELLGAGIAKAWLGKAVVPDDVPSCTGAIGLLGTRPSWDMMQQCDALLVVGSSFPYAEFYPPVGQARGVQIDRDGRMLSLRYPMEVNLKGDARETLAALLALLDRKRDRSWQNKLIEAVR